MILSPLDLERTFGLTGGDIMHGHMALDQLWAARPLVGHQQFSFCPHTVTKGQKALPLGELGFQGASGGGLANAIIASRWSHEGNTR